MATILIGKIGKKRFIMKGAKDSIDRKAAMLGSGSDDRINFLSV